MLNYNRYFLHSVVLHLGLFGLALFFLPKHLALIAPPSDVLFTRVAPLHRQIPKQNTAANATRPGQRSHGGLDLRPSFARYGTLFANQPGQPDENGSIHDLLHTDGKTLQAFDLLAGLINVHLEYPTSLAENGVQGLASVDLYFDHEARVDEAVSKAVSDRANIQYQALREQLEAYDERDFRGINEEIAGRS